MGEAGPFPPHNSQFCSNHHLGTGLALNPQAGPALACLQELLDQDSLLLSSSLHPHTHIWLSGIETPDLFAVKCIHQIAFSIRLEVSWLSALPPTQAALS